MRLPAMIMSRIATIPSYKHMATSTSLPGFSSQLDHSPSNSLSVCAASYDRYLQFSLLWVDAKHALHSVLHHCALMAPISSQNAAATALTLTEQITDLCNYCVNLAEAMVKYKEPSDIMHAGYTHICSDPGPEVCRFCEVVTKPPSTHYQWLLNLMVWKKDILPINQIYNGGARLHGPDSENPRRICGVRTDGRAFIV